MEVGIVHISQVRTQTQKNKWCKIIINISSRICYFNTGLGFVFSQKECSFVFCVFYFPLSLPSVHQQKAYHNHLNMDTLCMDCLHGQRIKGSMGDFPGGPVVKAPYFHHRSASSIPGWGTRSCMTQGMAKKDFFLSK